MTVDLSDCTNLRHYTLIMSAYQPPNVIPLPKIYTNNELRVKSSKELFIVLKQLKKTKLDVMNYLARCSAQEEMVATVLEEKEMRGERWKEIAKKTSMLLKGIKADMDVFLSSLHFR